MADLYSLVFPAEQLQFHYMYNLWVKKKIAQVFSQCGALVLCYHKHHATGDIVKIIT